METPSQKVKRCLLGNPPRTPGGTLYKANYALMELARQIGFAVKPIAGFIESLDNMSKRKPRHHKLWLNRERAMRRQGA